MFVFLVLLLLLTRRRDVDVEWMYELRQSPVCPPQTYDLHSNDTIKFLVYYSTALRLPVPSNCALQEAQLLLGDRATRKHAKDC